MYRQYIKTWWTGIDLRYSSFTEQKNRQVVAQGVPALGSLSSFIKLINDEVRFKNEIVQLGDITHQRLIDYWWYEDRDSNINKIPKSMFNLLSITAGDLIVALEGTTIKGICQMTKNAADSYEYHNAHNYAHTVGYPVKWLVWDKKIFGSAPIAPGQSVYGIRRLIKQRDYVISCWEKYKTIFPVTNAS